VTEDPITSAAERIAAGGRESLLAQLRPVFERRAARFNGGPPLDPGRLEQAVQAAADRAEGAQWRRALAEVACAELGLDLTQAIWHPAVERAHELVGAPPWTPPGGPRPETRPGQMSAGQTAAEQTATGQALRIAAVHLGGIETVRVGDRDIELRLSPAGLDVLRRSNGVAIGRLEWSEIATIELPRSRKGLRPGSRRVQELHVSTDRGEASFELPGLTDEQVGQHLEPTLARLRGR
jgi:hypothetical protein